jgi:hypothetical protein
MFRSYVERGEFEIVHTVKEIKDCFDFLKEIDEVDSFMNYWFGILYSVKAFQVAMVPKNYKL